MHLRPACITILALQLACALGVVRADATRHALEAFTEPYQSIDVAAPEPGRIAGVLVQRGSVVAPGDLLLELDTSVLEAARRVAAQRAASTADLEAYRIDAGVKERRHQTMTALRREHAVTPEELLTAESEWRIAVLKVQAAQEELDRAALELAELEARLEQRRVRAPIAGVVTDVKREPGEFVSAAEPEVLTVVDLSRLRATFYVSTADALRLRTGARVTLEAPSPGVVTPVATADPPLLQGSVEHISPVTQADSGRVRVDVVIDNAAGRHRSGLRCLLRIESGPVALRLLPDGDPPTVLTR